MTLQNRVLPTGEITAQPWRGTLMGNRGILHDSHQQLETRRWQHPHWVTCVLKHKDWHREVMTPNNYTELFFLDEPAALAAGHRPCALCRRPDYNRFRAAWAQAHGQNSLLQDDRFLHKARVNRSRVHRRHSAPLSTLPDGTFIWRDGATQLIWNDKLLRCDRGTYTHVAPRPVRGDAEVLTPEPTVAALLHGYLPALHPAARKLIENVR